MRFRTIHLFSVAVLASLLHCPPASADLGTCMVLRGGDSDLEGEFYDSTVKSLYEAHSVSDLSDGDFVFVLKIAGKSRPTGSYEIRPIELALGERTRGHRPWTLRGCRITAPDVAGIRNGVAELISAFKAGIVLQLRDGRRDGRVASPLLRDAETD